MSGFKLHNLPHLSASSINTWIYSRHNWVLQYLYLFKQKTPTNAAMKRGLVVEDAIVSILSGKQDEAAAIDAAVKAYNLELLFSNDKNLDLERANIPAMVRQGVTALGIYGKPDIPPDTGRHKQHKVSTLCRTDKWTLPVIGYLDLVYPNHKFVIDIKTTNKLPEDMPAAHRRQAAIYIHALPEYDVVFQYLSTDGTISHQVDNVANEMAAIKDTIIDIEAFLSSSPDRDVLLQRVMEDKNEKQRQGLQGSTPGVGVYSATSKEGGDNVSAAQ